MQTILVTGGTGMIGRSLQEIMPEAIYVSSADYDLTIQDDVTKMFRYIRPDIVIHLAAMVSGIQDNMMRPSDHFEDNILMNAFMVQAARKFQTPNFIGMLSTCIYPDNLTIYPLIEEEMHLGPPTATNFSYGYAKRCLAVQIDACNKQYGTNYSYLIPCNVMGRYDKFDEIRSHFMGSLIRKIYEAKQADADHITLYGTGKALRQHVDASDVANIIKYCIAHDLYRNMNIAPEEEYSIAELAKIALNSCECSHMQVRYDHSKPDGQYRKTVSNQLLKCLIPDIEFMPLEKSIREVFDYYSANIVK